MIHNITGHTSLYALLGHPVSHSISPQMHNLAFRECGIDAVYLAFDIDKNETASAVNALKTLPIAGCNLTMPLKRSVIPFLDELSDASSLCGSVNTIVLRDDGSTFGDTTDGTGFLDSLAACGSDIAGKTLCLLGPGGAGAAIAASAALTGAKKIFLCKRKNKSWDDMEKFSEEIAARTACSTEATDIKDKAAMHRALSESDILINATPVGMEGTGDEETSPIDKSLLHSGLFVADIIYHPEKTRLLEDAESCGCRILNGKYMLLYQGAASFKLWTGKEMPVQLVKDKYF